MPSVYLVTKRLTSRCRQTSVAAAEVLGQGLLTSEGELWRRQRRLTQPVFQLDQIHSASSCLLQVWGVHDLVQRFQTGALSWAHRSSLVRRPKLVVLRIGCRTRNPRPLAFPHGS